MRASLIALALAFCLAGPVAASDQTPFKGTLDATATVTPLDPPLASVLLEGSGVALGGAGRKLRFAITAGAHRRASR